MSTTKGSTRMILVHVQKMYKACTEDVQYIQNINRICSEHALLIEVPDYSTSSESYGGKQKNVENDGHLNKQL